MEYLQLPEEHARRKWQFDTIPDLSSTTPTDFKLLKDYLRPNCQRFKLDAMNYDDSLMNPWELPGMPPHKEEGNHKKQKYFLTDCPDQLHGSPRTSQGFWQPRSSGRGWGIRDGSNPSRFAGTKMTYDFHMGDPSSGGTKTNWVMNVYLLVGRDGFIQNTSALCHVFENNSPDYDPRPKCAAFHQPPNGEGKLCNQANHGPSSSSSLSTHPVSDQTLQPESTSYQEELVSESSLSTHPVSDQTLPPGFTSYLEGLENLLLGEPDASTDTGSYDARGGGGCDARGGGEKMQPRKRTRTSPVWERFTKIFAHGPDSVMYTLAVCNHCCRVLIGDSKNGTSHLARHKCQCNHGNKFRVEGHG